MLAGFLHNTGAGYKGPIFVAQAIVTSPVIWTTAAGTGGPLLYNGTSNRGVTAHILAVSWGLTVASTVSGAIGFTVGSSTAPSATTAIDSSGCVTPVGFSGPACNVYRVGTVSAAGTLFMPLGHVHTGAVTVDTDDDNWVNLGGGILVPPGSFFSVAASATLTSAVLQIGLAWMEVAND